MELPYEGQNTRAFDEACFAAPLGQPQKVRSAWGVHLILVTERGTGQPAFLAPDTPVEFSPDSMQQRNDAGRSL